MTVARDAVLEMLYDCIDELNEQLGGEERMGRDPKRHLLGEGALDSLGFVNFVALAEEGCERAFGLSISLTEIARKENVDPFETVGTFADFLCTVVNRADGGGSA